jgi:CheY-like chemotaxis protein
MSLALYHRPSAILFLDDDASYLEAMGLAMPDDWCLQLYSRVDEFIAHVNKQSTHWERDLEEHQSMINQWHQGASLPQLMVKYWTKANQRYALANTCVVDYAMPAMNGLNVLSKCPPWLTFRILLTGKADESTAVRAFNDGLIERFMTKQHPDLAKHLHDTLSQYYYAPLDFHDGIWRYALSKKHSLVLRESEVRSSLRWMLLSQHFVEYVILPEPFGVLALDENAQVFWVQLELQEDLKSAAELARAAGVEHRHLEPISQGRMLCNAELMQKLDSQLLPAVQAATRVGSSRLYAAIFPLPELGAVGNTYTEMLSSRAPRQIDTMF